MSEMTDSLRMMENCGFKLEISKGNTAKTFKHLKPNLSGLTVKFYR